jgi:hexokinase
MSVSGASPAVGLFCVPRSPPRIPRFRMAVRSSAISVAPILIELKHQCATPLPVLRHVADAMAADMRAGLAVDGGSDLKMILSYVDSLPTGYVCYLWNSMSL